uniref:Methyltransferase like 25 n=2 Tax=Leptobrachium leishanense TaxID=445787 RepID=A0A8C5QJQ9_9ANUR
MMPEHPTHRHVFLNMVRQMDSSICKKESPGLCIIYMLSVSNQSMMFSHLPEVSADQVKDAIRKLVPFLEATHQISDAHTVDFYTEDVWEKLVAVSPHTVLSTLSQHPKTYLYETRDVSDLSSIFSTATKKLENLEAFVKASHYHSLVNFGVCTEIDKLLEAFAIHRAPRADAVVKADQFMNDKKSHEVLIMADLVNTIANVCGVKQVIDLGAGKGYLSSYLSMRYDLQVYGIDSSHTNTDGAKKRNRKLKKYWQVYKTNTRKTSKAPESDQRKASLLPKESCLQVNTNTDTSHPENSAVTFQGLSISDSKTADDIIVAEDSLETESHKVDCPTQDTADLSKNTFLFSDVLPSGAVELPLMSHNVPKVLSEEEKAQRKAENMKSKKQSESSVYKPLTSYVTADTELRDIIADFKETIMVGLHTCGDLAPNTLRIFTSKPEIKAVCSVGCCYHLLSEKFDHPDKGDTVEACGFPLSQYLSERYCRIGRNARMSACLALERVAVGQGLPVESLFYRAVLQVICRDIYGVTQREWQQLQMASDPKDKNSDKRVGKIYAKSRGFADYIRKSLRKLGQDDSKLSDKEIMEFYETFKDRKIELEAFNMLKVSLAPCIEALILLDRLCYLKEQGNFGWSGVVRLFDPVKSPRCYAVMSMKHL